ncbi:hypothetical protein FRC10_008841 [Ceratobasidium sp. 414]|nr:hypothetical protein FRC10_008841 [Ceratobasidium sp. 414]
MSSRSPLESKVGELRVVSRPQHIEVDTNERHIQAFELRVRCAGVSRHEFIGRECRANPPGSIVNFQGKVIREDEHICANFTVDIPPSLHPPHGGEYTYELVASVTIVTTDAMGAKGVIARTGVAEIDITSKHSPVFINPLTPSGPGPWSYTRC